MELFSEIYNCYYQIIKSILDNNPELSLDELRSHISDNGYEESLLYLVPKLQSGEWRLLKQDGDTYISRLTGDFYVPLTTLQKSYIKAILQDIRIQLFFESDELQELQQLFADIPALWTSEDFYYYDRYTNRDEYENAQYQQHFRTLVNAIRNHQYVDITYESRFNHRVHHHYLPCRLEYSIKNDKFRLLGIVKGDRKQQIEILNLDRMKDVRLLPTYADTIPDIDKSIQESYYKEPVHLLIHTERNALERTMLQFANYKKNTTKLDDQTYECLIYYNQKMETELLIEVLSFGPMIEVLGNERFLHSLKQRLYKQKRLIQQ